MKVNGQHLRLFPNLRTNAIKKQGGLPTTSLVNTQFSLKYLIDPNRVFRFHRLLRITDYVLRFVNGIQRKPCHTGSPTTTEIKTTEILRTKEAQRNMDTKQLESQLGLFVDEDQVIVTRDVWVMQNVHMLRDFLPCCLVVIGSLL